MPDLKNLIQHNKEISANSLGNMSNSEIRGVYETTVQDFANELINARNGFDANGQKVAPRYMHLSDALSKFYGLGFSGKSSAEIAISKRKTIKRFAKGLGFDIENETMDSFAKTMGQNLTAANFKSIMIDYQNYFTGKPDSFNSTVNNTEQIDPNFRFLLPEIILGLLQTDYEHSSMHQNWIGQTVNIGRRKATVPMTKRGNMTPRRIGEGESIPVGGLLFGQKEISCFKVGVGFEITDEMRDEVPLDLAAQAMAEAGNDLSICSDFEAFNVLVNGEEASESAPVVGVETIGSTVYRDLKKVDIRMGRLNKKPNRVINNEDNSLDISLLDEFKGFDGINTLGTIQGLMALRLAYQEDIYIPPTTQSMLLNSAKAMSKLQYGSLMMEEDRNKANQTNAFYMTDHIGFWIMSKDARVIIDNSLAFASNGFPASMDIDSRISQAFQRKRNYK